MRRKKLSWLVLLVFTFSVFAPLTIVSPAQAGTMSDIVDELSNVYPYIDDVNVEDGKTDKAALAAARTALQALAANQSDSAWDAILKDPGNELLTDEVNNRFGSEAEAKNKLIGFIADAADLYYSTDAAQLEADLNDFKTAHRATFTTLFGSDVSIDDLFQLLTDTRTELLEVIEASDLDALAWGTNSAMLEKITDLTQAALTEAISSELTGKLSAIDWSTEKIINVRSLLAGEIDTTTPCRSELALAKALVRSQAELYAANATTKLNKNAEQPLNAGTPVDYHLFIMGKKATGLVEWASSNDTVASVSVASTGFPTITPLKAGTAVITAYRDYEGGTAAKDWILKFTVNVTGTANANANLSALEITSGTLIPAFDANVTEYTVTLPSTHSGAVPTVTAVADDANATAEVTQADDYDGTEEERTAEVVVTASNGTTQKTYKVTFVKRTVLNTAAAIATGTPENPTSIEVPTIEDTNKNFELPEITPDDIDKVELNLNVGDVANASVTVAAAGLETKTALLPQMNIINSDQMTVTIPAGTTITGPDTWDGTIVMPTVKTTPSASVGGTASAVVEVGFGDTELKFDNAVRLLLPGQAGKSAAYVRGGKSYSITRTVSADSQTTADSELGAGQEGKINVGSDMAIWTKHFTEFVAYTPASSGGGGGGSSFGGITINAATGGTVTASGVTVVIPANAFSKDVAVKIVKLTSTSSLQWAANSVLISDVLEISKNQSADFTKAVTITIPFDKTLFDAEKYNLAICYYNETTKQWIALDNISIDYDNSKVSGETTHFTKFAVIAASKEGAPVPVIPEGISDISGNWAEANIKALIELGAIAGYPDNTFKPDNTITRAEFATVLVKAFQLEAKTGKVFSDTADHWAKDSIATANAHGIINGYSDTQFGPDDKVTREQMAVMIAQVAGLTDTTGAKVFADQKDISAWAADAVAATSAKQIINGYPDNTFKPQGNATRAEAVTIIVQALNQ